MKAQLTFGQQGLALVDLDGTADEIASVIGGLAAKPVVNVTVEQDEVLRNVRAAMHQGGVVSYVSAAVGWKDNCRTRNGPKICDEPCSVCRPPLPPKPVR